MADKKFKRIAVSGGPCSGKTLGITSLAERLRNLGWRPFVTPEVATLVIEGGVYDMERIAREDRATFLGVQKNITLTQLALESQFEKLTENFPKDKIVMFNDRALLDQIAYAGRCDFEEILRHEGMSTEDALGRYDAVIFMVTAAIGAEKFYGNETNKARYEDLEWARALDRRTLAAWSVHPNLHVIDNSTDFEGKKNRMFGVVCKILGIAP